MTNRRTLIPTILAVALFALVLPVMAAAQGGYDPYGRNRDRRDNNYRYDQRGLRDSVKRVKDRSDNFEKELDRALDRSRYDDTRREDRVNDVAEGFHRAAENLDDRFDNGRDINRSSNEARRLLQIGTQIDRFMSRNRLGGRAESEWSRIRQDLRVIAAAYGFNWSDFDDRYNRRDNDRDRRGNNRRNNYPR